jgi:hypothetical protein
MGGIRPQRPGLLTFSVRRDAGGERNGVEAARTLVFTVSA